MLEVRSNTGRTKKRYRSKRACRQDRTSGFKPWRWRWPFKRTQYVARRAFQTRYVGNETGLFTNWTNSLVWITSSVFKQSPRPPRYTTWKLNLMYKKARSLTLSWFNCSQFVPSKQPIYLGQIVELSSDKRSKFYSLCFCHSTIGAVGRQRLNKREERRWHTFNTGYTCFNSYKQRKYWSVNKGNLYSNKEMYQSRGVSSLTFMWACVMKNSYNKTN